MRYWWRAAKAEPDTEELFREEAWLFGSSAEGSGKSPFSLRIRGENGLIKDHYRPLPHSESKTFTLKGFSPEGEFSLLLSTKHNLELYCTVLELSIILGGLGKRARRGFGSLSFKGGDWDRVYQDQDSLIDCIYKKLALIAGDDTFSKEKRQEKGQEKGSIIRRRTHPTAEDPPYPWIKEVFIGDKTNGWEELVKKIGKASHAHDDPSLGTASHGRRMASPVYVSAVKLGSRFAPVVTTLESVFPENYGPANMDKQKSFKGAL